jgi:hypothetical protein
MCQSHCGFDLSTKGQFLLLQSYYESNHQFFDMTNLVLQANHVSADDLVREYGRDINGWMPIIDIDKQLEGIGSLSDTKPRSFSLLLIGILLVTRHYCSHSSHRSKSCLYNTLKQLLSTVINFETPDATLVQANLLLILYECGHGLTWQAQLTLNSTIALVSQLNYEASCGKKTVAQIHFPDLIIVMDW